MARTWDLAEKEIFHNLQNTMQTTSREKEKEIKKKLPMDLCSVPEEKKVESLEWQEEQCQKSRHNKTC